MAITDEEIEKLAEQVEDRQKRKQMLKPVQNIPSIIQIIMVVGLGALFYFGDAVPITKIQKILILIVVVVIFFAVSSKPFSEGLLPEQEITSIANKQLVYKLKHSLHAGFRQINDPNSIVRVHLEGVLVTKEWGGEYLYWEHGFSIVTRDGTTEYQGSIRNDPYTGMCVGIVERPEGYSGREEVEKEIITTADLKKYRTARRMDAEDSKLF
jgi:hypothetical protein